MKSTIWVLDFFLDDIEAPATAQHPIFSYIVINTFWQITWLKNKSVLDTFNIIIYINLIFAIFLIAKKITKNEKKSVIICCLASISPIFFWILSHRLVDYIYIYFILISFLLLVQTRHIKIYAIALFLSLILQSKLTWIFFIIPTGVYLIFFHRKKVLIWIGFWLLINLPFLWFYYNNIWQIYPYKSINYKNIDRSNKQIELDWIVNSKKIIDELKSKDELRLKNFSYYINSKNINWILQYFSLQSTTTDILNNHWFWEKNHIRIHLLLTMLALVSLYKKRNNNKDLIIILILLIISSFLINTITSIHRYWIYFNILFTIILMFFAINHRNWKIVVYTSIFLFITTNIPFIINDNLQYYYSLDHTPLNSVKKSFIHDYNTIKNENPQLLESLKKSCIYSRSRESAYYFETNLKRDSRINELSVNNFKEYYDELVWCKHLILPIYWTDNESINMRTLEKYFSLSYTWETINIYKYQ